MDILPTPGMQRNKVQFAPHFQYLVISVEPFTQNSQTAFYDNQWDT